MRVFEGDKQHYETHEIKLTRGVVLWLGEIN
jgi:hypothetical protein